MKKGKLLLTAMLVTALFSTTIVSAEGLENYSKSDESTQASGEQTVEWVIPHNIKIGEEITTIAVGKNLPVSVDGEQAYVTVTSPLYNDAMLFEDSGYHAHAYGAPKVDEDGTGTVTTGHTVNGISAFRPCSIVLNFSVANLSGDVITVGEPYTVTVEEPIIQDNAPQTVEDGDSIYLQTELTNTALTNTDVAYYYDSKNYDVCLIEDSTHKAHVAAYQPSVEVIEGTELVEQSEQDYSNTLNSSEKLTFTGEGTVKLRIVYNQIVNCPSMEYSPDEYALYNPEKIVTIQVGSLGAEDDIIQNDDTGVPDKTLYEALLKQADDGDGVLTRGELDRLEKLDVQNKTISSLEGIQYCTNLKWLILCNDQISDISPLDGMYNLESLWLDGNNITDISALSGLVNLSVLKVSNNNISDIEAVSNLINLTSLDVSGNKIVNLPDLTDLTQLDPSQYGPYDYMWYVLFSENNISLDDAIENLPSQLLSNAEWVERQGFVSSPSSVYEQQLKDKLTEIENAALSKDDYTAESWNAYINAANYAKSILNKQNATDEEYRNALTMLENAQKGLVKAGGSVTGSKGDTTKPNGSDSKDTVAKDSAVPKTGDTANIVFAVIIMAGTLLILGITGAKRKVK